MKSKMIRITLMVSTLILISTLPVHSDVFSAAERLARDAAGTVVTLSTPAALIGVGTGAFMKKFSMGDHQKVAMGSKVFWSSIGGWATINGITLILDTVKNYIR